jgi:hypothetical protein
MRKIVDNLRNLKFLSQFSPVFYDFRCIRKLILGSTHPLYTRGYNRQGYGFSAGTDFQHPTLTRVPPGIKTAVLPAPVPKPNHEMRGDVIEDNSVVSLEEGMDGSQQEFVCTRRGKIFMGSFE